MLVCHVCTRHYQAVATQCPFCATSLRVGAAPSALKLGAVALALGLSVMGCDDEGDTTTSTTTSDTGETTTNTETETGAEAETGAETETTTTEEEGSAESDYGCPPPANAFWD